MRQRNNSAPSFSVYLRPIFIAILCLAALTFETLAATQSAAAQEAVAPTVLITGSSRGIGLEFTRQYARRGWTVIATCAQQGRSVLAYLERAVHAYFTDQPIPSLLPAEP